jgi:hypothetical protein
LSAIQALYSGKQTIDGIKEGRPLAFVDAGLSLIGLNNSVKNLGEITRRAAYNNITPLGYNDGAGVGLGKKKELWNMFKDVITGG